MAKKQILLRSPYFVNKELDRLISIRVDLYVYTGTFTTDKPTVPNYTLSATAFQNSNSLKYAEIDIAPYCRDFLDVTFDFDNDNPSNAVWIEWDLYYSAFTTKGLIKEGSYTAMGLDGYNYFEEGYNKEFPDKTLMSGAYIVIPTGQDTTIPVLQDNLVDYDLNDGTTLLEGITPRASTTASADIVLYADTTTAAGTPDNVVLNFGGGVTRTIQLRYNNQCRNENIEVSFINRYGAVQRAWFFGKSSQSLTTTQQDFKRNLLDGTGGYSILEHQNDILQKNGMQSIICNTGFYPEDSNYLWQEMLLSERVWLSTSPKKILSDVTLTDTITVPVTLKDSSVQYKTKLDDKLINYQFTFEYAADRINNVR